MRVTAVLEMINGSLAILAFELAAICVLYCVYQSNKLRMGWRDWAFAMPVGIAFALALMTNNIGDVIRYAFVWWWRFSTDGRGQLNVAGATVGSIIAGIGILLLIYVLTREWFGVRVLLVCTGSVLAFIAGSFLLRL